MKCLMGPPISRDLLVRFACVDDLSAVYAIEQASYLRPWTLRHFQDELSIAQSYFWVGFSSELSGYLILRDLGEALHIINVAVHPLVRGRGIGAILVKQAISEAQKLGRTHIVLEVRNGNQAALKMYENLGFCRVGLVRGHYGDAEDAILLERVLNPVGSEVTLRSD